MMPMLLAGVSALPGTSCVTVPVDDPRQARAEAFERVGSWAEAAALWNQIYLDSRFQDLDAGRQAARASLVAGRPGDARARLDDLLRRSPGDPGLLELRGVAHEELGLLEAARADHQAALAVDPERPAALARLGALEAAAGETERGLDHLVEGVALDPSDRGAQLQLGLLLARSEQLDRAAEAFDAAFEGDRVSPRVPLEARLEAARLMPGDPRAARWLELVVRERPQHTEALWRLGQSEFAGQQRAAGLRHLAEAAESDPGDVPALAAYAAALSSSGRTREAEAVLDHARGLTLSPGEAALLDALAEPRSEPPSESEQGSGGAERPAGGSAALAGEGPADGVSPRP